MPAHPAARGDHTFVDDHGITVHYSVWRSDRPRAVVQIAHGVGEYATRYEHVAQTLVGAGYAVYADDHRGHGRTGLEQWDGDHAKLGRLGPGGLRAAIAAIRRLTAIARDAHPGLPLALLGHSWGSLMAQKIIDRDASPYAAAVLSGTAYRTPRHMNSGDLNRRHATPGGTGFEWLNRDQDAGRAFRDDPLTFDAKVLKLFGLADSLRLYGRPPRGMSRDLPMLIQVGGDDPLGGARSATKLAEAYRRAGLADVKLDIYPDARHEIYHELNRDEVIGDLVDWLDTRLAPPTR